MPAKVANVDTGSGAERQDEASKDKDSAKNAVYLHPAAKLTHGRIVRVH